jgi:hypothetical protein
MIGHDALERFSLNRSSIALLSVLMLVPLIWPTIPPLTDLPGHMGRYAIQLDDGSDPFLVANYKYLFQLSGNLGVDLLIIPLAPMFGLEVSVKMIVMAVPAIAAAGMLFISREIHGRITPAAIVALPLAYGHPFTYGFINFSLSMALALCAFALWLRLGRKRQFVRRVFLFAFITTAIWLVHSYGWIFLGILCFSTEIIRARNDGKNWLGALFEAAIHCLCFLPAFMLTIFWRSDVSESGISNWFVLINKFQSLVMTFRDRWRWIDIASVVFVLAFIYETARRKGRQFAPKVAFPAILLFAAFLIMPSVIFNSYFADMRLTPYIFIMTLLAINGPSSDERSRKKWLYIIAFAFLFARVGINTASFYLYDARHSSALKALEHLPVHSRLLTFVQHCPYWFTERTEHISGLAIVRRKSFSNDQWSTEGGQAITVVKTDAPGFSKDPSQFVTDGKCESPGALSIDDAVAEFPRAAFDYLWIINAPKMANQTIKGLNPVWSNGQDTLYRITKNMP